MEGVKSAEIIILEKLLQHMFSKSSVYSGHFLYRGKKTISLIECNTWQTSHIFFYATNTIHGIEPQYPSEATWHLQILRQTFISTWFNSILSLSAGRRIYGFAETKTSHLNTIDTRQHDKLVESLACLLLY